MIQFTYSFCMALLHSFWQAAVLMLLYITVDKIIHRNNAPIAKRNFLYSALAVQLILSVLTFSVYFFDTAVPGKITGFSQIMADYLSSENIQSLAPWVFSFYIFIITYKLSKAIYSWYHFKKQYKTGLQKASVDLKLFTELKAYQFGIKRKVKLWLSNSIHTPVTFGFFRPIILLPVVLLNNISMQQAETLILHELTHIRTNDYLLNWFLMVSETVFFFNPFITGLCKKIRLEREKNCDIQVMSFEYSPALYAETLLHAERVKQLVPNFQLAAVNRKKHLLQRIQFFSNDKTLNQPRHYNIIAPLSGLILFFVLSAAILFNSGNAPTGLNTSTIPFLPFSNYAVSEIDFGKNNLPEKKYEEPPAGKTEIQQLQVIENEVKKIEPAIENVSQNTEEIAKITAQNFAMPVTVYENDASKQIIIQEESSGSKSASVRVYSLSFDNGQWILQPQWVVTAKQVILDSLQGKIDSLSSQLKRILPPQQ